MATHVAKALPAVKTIVDTVSASVTPQFCEFEMRLGKLTAGGGFEPGVDAAFVGSLLCKLETSKAWTEVTPWTQIVDRFYLLPSGLQVRTSSQATLLSPASTDGIDDDEDDEDELYAVGADSDDDSKDAAANVTKVVYSYETSHIIKTSIAHVDLKWDNADACADFLNGKDGTVYGMRVALKHEAPVFEDELQECVEETNTVRIKQRRSFRYTPAGKDRVQWSIDITQVWQSAAYTDAMECLRRGDEPKYEVEIECIDVHDCVRSANGDSRRVALSMLLKIADLFNVDSESGATMVPV